MTASTPQARFRRVKIALAILAAIAAAPVLLILVVASVSGGRR